MTGDISYDGANHARMTEIRAAKVAGMAADLPPLEVDADPGAELLVLGWGSSRGAIRAAARRVRANGHAVAIAHLHHLQPLPCDLGELLHRYERVLVPEMNSGQLASVLRASSSSTSRATARSRAGRCSPPSWSASSRSGCDRAHQAGLLVRPGDALVPGLRRLRGARRRPGADARTGDPAPPRRLRVRHRLRQDVAAARKLGAREPLSAALVSLGGALVHSARGTDEEGAAALHEATMLAEELGRDDIAATGWREIAWVQFLRGQYERADESLTRTAQLARGRDEDLAWVDVTRGASRHDTGDHAAAGELLRSGVERAKRLSSGQPLAMALTMLGRYHLLRGEIDEAQQHLDQALHEVKTRGMTAFVSWPEAFRGELDLILGNVDAAEARFEHAFALGCEVGDACWESIGLRGLGLVAAVRGDISAALERLTDAPKLCPAASRIRTCGSRPTASTPFAPSQSSIARRALCAGSTSSTPSPRSEASARAPRTRNRLPSPGLGEPGSSDAARALAAQIDNPVLEELFGLEELTTDAL